MHACVHDNLYVYVSQTLMKKVTEEFPDDVEAWIELAAILEKSDVAVSACQSSV